MRGKSVILFIFDRGGHQKYDEKNTKNIAKQPLEKYQYIGLTV